MRQWPHTAALISVKAMDGVNAREFSFGSFAPRRLDAANYAITVSVDRDGTSVTARSAGAVLWHKDVW
jgi:hypothetical protein